MCRIFGRERADGIASETRVSLFAVVGNVALLPTWLGWDEVRIRERVAALCDLARLPTKLLERFPQSLSGGQRQRVALVRALMTDPALLLLDEPLGALVPMVRAELQHDLRAAFASLGKTVILVTHDLGEASHFADDVVLLREGRVLQQGPSRRWSNRPRTLS